MKNYAVDAIALKSYSLNDFDKIVVLFSKEKGLLKCIAKGAKKPKSSIGGNINSLIASKILLAKGKNLDIISQIQSINSFSNLRKDFVKLNYAMYLAELINNFSLEDDTESAQIYNLFYNTLHTLSKSQNKLNSTLCVMKFQLNFMELLGYQPSLSICTKCGNTLKEITALSSNHGGALCLDCITQERKVHTKLLDFLKKIANSDFEYKYFIDEPIKNELTIYYCFNFLKNYVQANCPKKLKSQEMLEII